MRHGVLIVQCYHSFNTDYWVGCYNLQEALNGPDDAIL